MSGLPDVPRVDRYLSVVKSVINCSTYASHQDSTEVVGSCLQAGAPGNPQEAKKILATLDGPIQSTIRKALGQTVCASIALDKSADVMILIACLLLPTGIFDTVLGLETDMGSEAADVTEAVVRITRRSCTKLLSHRDLKAAGCNFK